MKEMSPAAMNVYSIARYSKIPILRPPLGLSKSGLEDHFWQSQRWSLIRGTIGVENEEKSNLNFANKVLNR